MMRKRNLWPLVLIVNVLCLCVLSFYRPSPAAPKQPTPFANPVGQRSEIIEQLKELNRLVRQQNALLSSGQLKVVVVDKRSSTAGPAKPAAGGR